MKSLNLTADEKFVDELNAAAARESAARGKIIPRNAFVRLLIREGIERRRNAQAVSTEGR